MNSRRGIARLSILSPELAGLVEQYRAASVSTATARAYASALRSWATWCESRGAQSWPPLPEFVEAYAADLAQRGRSLATIDLAIAALSDAVRRAGDALYGAGRGDSLATAFRSSVKQVRAGIRRTHGIAPRRKARPLLARELSECLRTLPRHTRAGVRERALLLLGWACAMRASDLVGLDRGDVIDHGRDFVVNIRRSKTDQDGAGVKLRVECDDTHDACPACALRAWLAMRGDESGSLLGVSKRFVSRAVKRAADRLGLNGGERKRSTSTRRFLEKSPFSGHSLRRGYVTSATLAGVSEREVMRVTRHASVKVFRGYVEDAEALAGITPATIALGLAARKGETRKD